MQRLHLYIIILLFLIPTALFAKRPGVKDVPEYIKAYHQNLRRGENYYAYLMIARVDSIYRAASDSQKEKLTQQGYGRSFINTSLEHVCELAINEADSIDTREAFDFFMVYYDKAPKSLRVEASALRRYTPSWEFSKQRQQMKEQWIRDHDRVILSCDRDNLGYFREKRSYRLFPEEKAKDDRYLALPEDADTATIIREVAPYFPAFVMLVKSVQPMIKRGDYAAAASEVLKYADVFGTDHRYNDLLRVLSDAMHQPRRGDVWHELFVDIAPDRLMYCPALSADGRFLYFCGRDIDRATGMEYDEDIYVSERENDDWAEPMLVRELSTPQRNDAIESITTDGSQVFMFINGATYVTARTAGGWMPLKPWSKEINKMSHWISDVHLSADGKAALFAIAVSNEFMAGENFDIYVTLMDEKGEWGAPFSIGTTINTILNERSPLLHPDGRTLYFTANGHSSLGGYDIFRTRRLEPSSWTEWSEPENVGLLINSVNNEMFFSVNTQGTTLYMSSGPNSALRLYEMPMPETMRPDPIATLAGFIHTPQGEPIGADIRWEDLTTGEDLGIATSNPKDGSFFLTLPLGHLYGYYVDEQGFMPASDNVDLRPVSEATTLTADIEIMPIKTFITENKVMEIHNLFFALDKADILPESQPELRRLAQLIQHIGHSVVIAGHADNSGSAQHNMSLSQARAEAVRDFLIVEGCDAARISAVGYGDTRPIDSNDTEEGRRHNRRVEIEIK